MSEDKTYNNIQNGSEVILTADEYTSSQLATPIKFEEQFFKNFIYLFDYYIVKPYSNGTVLYRVKYKELHKEIYILWGPLKNSGIQGNDNKRIQVLNTVDKPVPDRSYYAIGAYNTLDKMVYAMITKGIKEFIENARNGVAYSSLWISYDKLWDTYRKGKIDWEDGAGRNVMGVNDKEILDLHNTIIKEN